MSREQQMFLHAIDAFKRVNGVAFPTWTDVLEVVRRLGYRKTSASELNLGPKAEDWTEPADAPKRAVKGRRFEPESCRLHPGVTPDFIRGRGPRR